MGISLSFSFGKIYVCFVGGLSVYNGNLFISNNSLEEILTTVESYSVTTCLFPHRNHREANDLVTGNTKLHRWKAHNQEKQWTWIQSLRPLIASIEYCPGPVASWRNGKLRYAPWEANSVKMIDWLAPPLPYTAVYTEGIWMVWYNGKR